MKFLDCYHSELMERGIRANEYKMSAFVQLPLDVVSLIILHYKPIGSDLIHLSQVNRVLVLFLAKWG